MHCFRAKWIVPVEAPPIEDGAIVVDHGAIVAVGPFGEHCVSGAVDLGDVVVTPGLVNAHTHLEIPAIADALPHESLWTWLDALIDYRRQSGSREACAANVAAGAAASLRSGVTCVADISRTGVNVSPVSASPIRAVCFIELISGAAQRPSDARELFETVASAEAKASPGRLVIGVSPHTLYNVTESDLAAVARQLHASPRPTMIHFLETQAEAQWLQERMGPAADFRARYPLRDAMDYPRGEAVEVLDCCGLLSRRPILAHGNYVGPGAIEKLAAAGASVVWCPRTHAYFGHSRHPWAAMRRAGINVCLGTDSMASNPDLSILEEMRFLHRRNSSASAAAILQMATIAGARALGLDSQIGSLTVGKRADFICIPWDGDGASDPVLNLLNGSTAVSGVWIDGTRMRLSDS